jgi:hypothetical protein
VSRQNRFSNFNAKQEGKNAKDSNSNLPVRGEKKAPIATKRKVPTLCGHSQSKRMKKKIYFKMNENQLPLTY